MKHLDTNKWQQHLTESKIRYKEKFYLDKKLMLGQKDHLNSSGSTLVNNTTR